MANNPEHISENHTVQTISLINYFLIFYSGTVVTKSYYQLLESVTTGMKRNQKMGARFWKQYCVLYIHLNHSAPVDPFQTE